MIEAFGIAAMMSMGAVLGMLGAGGSILTLPILVYLFGVSPTLATGYSLAIVGASALAGAVEYLRRGQSSPRMALVFGLPAMVGVYLTRRFLFPALPDPVLRFGGIVLTKDAAVMILFAAFMLVAAVSMLRSSRGPAAVDAVRHELRNVPLILGLGFTVGVFTGMVGAGGGFMILPVLVLLGGLPVKVAIGTDLLIIAAKSLVGFVGEMQAVEGIDYGFVGLVTLLPLAGMAVGTYLNRRVSAPFLRAAFGWFLLAMGTYIVAREALFT
ncbi:MAG: sulfite exporter TauE/SafE family protein [Gemmatimonadota bacterium]|jgi:uncharacterized membrane protein YfcA